MYHVILPHVHVTLIISVMVWYVSAFSPSILFIFPDTQFSSMTYQKLYADRERYRRLLQAEEHTAGRHVPSHSSYWVCLPFGAFLTPIMVTIFVTQVQNSLHLFRFVDYALKWIKFKCSCYFSLFKPPVQNVSCWICKACLGTVVTMGSGKSKKKKRIAGRFNFLPFSFSVAKEFNSFNHRYQFHRRFN